MEQAEKPIKSDYCSTVIKASSSTSNDISINVGESQFKKKFHRRHAINSENGLGVNKVPVIKIEKKNDVLSSAKRYRKKFVLPDHIELITKDPALYRCTICKRSFKEKLHSKYHEPCSTGKKPLICGVCDKGFITKSHFDYHLRIHSDSKPFDCRFCRKKFAQKDKVKRHIRLTHFKERPHACTLCTKKFTSKQALQVHMNGHLRQRPYNCDLCMRCFTSKTVLQRHRLTHSAIRNFCCEICDKKFTLKSDLNIHLRVHSGVRPYQCTFDGCNKGFTLKTSFTRHLQTHSELHDYECSICVTAFRRKDNLERHMRNFHPETMVEGHSQQIVSIVQPKSFGLKKPTSKDVTSKNTECSIEENKNLGLSQKNIESEKNEVDEEQINVDHRRGADDDFTMVSEVDKESCQRLESSTSVIVETVKKSGKTSKSLSFENVSVINRSDNVPGTEKNPKLEQNNGANCRKTNESIVPYRTIAPSVKFSDNDRINCVPTITKVTHIVHTTKTGIPNIQTVITTRDVTKNKAKQSRDCNSEGVDRSGGENVIVEKQKRSKSVIKFVPKNSEKTTKKSVECYRILKPSSEFVTTCSNLGSSIPFPAANSLSGGNFEVFSGRKQQLYAQGGTFANAFENLCQELLSEDTSTRGDSSNGQNSRTKMMESGEFNRAFLQQYDDRNPKFYENSENDRFSNRLHAYNGVGLVSESCLLADNALDHNITDTLYEQQLNDSYSLHQMQNMDHSSSSNTFMPPRSPYLDTQQLYTYPNSNYTSYDYQQNNSNFQSYSVDEHHDPKTSNYANEDISRLEDLRIDYEYSRTNNVPSVARSVIVDQPKPTTVPASVGPRQLPLKKCLWTKSAFGNMLNDSSCTEVS